MQNRMKIDISTTTIIKVAITVLAILFIYAVRDIAVLFFVVIIVVMALLPIVDRMSKHMPRILAVILLSLVFLANHKTLFQHLLLSVRVFYKQGIYLFCMA